MSETQKILRVACDGSALRNPSGPGGWCWWVSDNHWASGGTEQASNNLMELTALAEMLRTLPPLPQGTLVRAYLDSQYVIDATTKWARGWERNGWVTKKGDPVKNAELIREITVLLKQRPEVELQWVAGHSGHSLNEAADSRARAAALAFARGTPLDQGPGWRADTTRGTVFDWPPFAVEVEGAPFVSLHVGGERDWWAWETTSELRVGEREFPSVAAAQLFAIMSGLRQHTDTDIVRILAPARTVTLFTAQPVLGNPTERFLLQEILATLQQRPHGWLLRAETRPLRVADE